MDGQNRQAWMTAEKIVHLGRQARLVVGAHDHDAGAGKPLGRLKFAYLPYLADDLHVGLLGDDLPDDLAQDSPHSDEKDVPLLLALHAHRPSLTDELFRARALSDMDQKIQSGSREVYLAA
jgi:hypothetical protein